MDQTLPPVSDQPADLPTDLPTRARHYQHMGEMLAYLSENWHRQPRLEDLAARMGLSSSHFQKLFCHWAGVSPKALVGSLTVAEARQCLLAGASVEEASDHTRLSSPSRLYDLCVRHEGLTPGALRQRGAGLVFKTGVVPCPFGLAVVLLAPKGIAALGFANPGEEEAALADLQARYPQAEFIEDEAACQQEVAGLFPPSGAVASANLALYGPPFHLQVWKALLAIPPGQTTTYGALAKAMGRPTAARAVGAAVGANPVSWLIPCHRVLASDGRLNGYHWGLPRKAAMLSYEELTCATGSDQ